MAGLERWKARHPGIVEYFEPADILVDGMRGRSALWYRIRVNLIHVPEDERPAQDAARVRLRPVGRTRHRGVEGRDGRAPRSAGGAEGANEAKDEAVEGQGDPVEGRGDLSPDRRAYCPSRKICEISKGAVTSS